MKSLKNKLSAAFLIVLVSAVFFSCEDSDPDKYDVRLRNDSYSESLGMVPTKHIITKFTIGETTIEEEIDYGDFSDDYFTVESDKEYTMTVEYDQYLYNADSDSWEFDQSNSDEIGPEEWGKEECNPQRITISIKEVMSLPGGSDYEVFCDD
ncbi:MAG: hypothetical protein ACOCQ4_00795 [bacterium]